MSDKVEIGSVFEFPYPFVRYAEKVFAVDVDNGFESTYHIEDRWKPGTEHRYVFPDDTEECYDGNGKCRLTVVGVYKPEGFPTRVFFKREWSPPNDDKFYGLNKCRIVSLGWFNRLRKGFQSNSYSILPPKLDDKGVKAARQSLKGEGE